MLYLGFTTISKTFERYLNFYFNDLIVLLTAINTATNSGIAERIYIYDIHIYLNYLRFTMLSFSEVLRQFIF